jgi:hypothetical protein
MSGSRDLPSENSTPAVQSPAPTRRAPPPSDTSTDAATIQANEILSDKTFDLSLNIEGPVSLDQEPRRAPDTLRRRGRGWRRHGRQ